MLKCVALLGNYGYGYQFRLGLIGRGSSHPSQYVYHKNYEYYIIASIVMICRGGFTLICLQKSYFLLIFFSFHSSDADIYFHIVAYPPTFHEAFDGWHL